MDGASQCGWSASSLQKLWHCRSKYEVVDPMLDGHCLATCSISRSACVGALGSVAACGAAWLGQRKARHLKSRGPDSGSSGILYLPVVYSRTLSRGSNWLAARKNSALPNPVVSAYSGPLSLESQSDLSGRTGDLAGLDRFLRERRSCWRLQRWLCWSGPTLCRAKSEAWSQGSEANTANSAVLHQGGWDGRDVGTNLRSQSSQASGITPE